MRRHWAGICGVGILVCAICVGSSAGEADANAHRRANEANARMCSRNATEGTQAEARHGGQVCATESVGLAQGAQTQSALQGGGADLHLLPRPREIKRRQGKLAARPCPGRQGSW